MTNPNTLGPKLIEWGGYLEACQTNEQLSRKAADLKQARDDANEMRRLADHEPHPKAKADMISRADDLMTTAEYAVLCGIGAKRRAELKGEQPCGT